MVFRQVLDCKHMDRAIKVHEVTMKTNEILKIREIMLGNAGYFVGVAKNLTQTVRKAITSMEVSKDNEFKDASFTLKSLLSAMNYWHSFSKPGKFQPEIIALYSRMVLKLSQSSKTIIKASYTRNWLQHLSSAQNLMKDFIAMDWIKYRKT